MPVGWGADRGAASVFVAISVAALVLVAAMVLDATEKIRMRVGADSVAQEAARAAGQQLDQAALRDGRYQVDQTAARRAAQDYLDAYAHGATGDTEFNSDDRTIPAGTVRVKIEKHYRPLLFGGDTVVPGIGFATLVHGVTEPENG
ncbi:hypothetical protein CFP65_6420 [Kitasatospora sp. MMS16-BH015]|uniref:hypothetical protein n=1 Tax=Kitasatospora sp. MMS16-BH015 TaxID=2018025 RepID=UPI000CA09CA6|nr:hypothetical protein [Kitasatospora sp. MMS16-BH015]AUG81076.1 hypothetical protein CFP65_6420 [Kitasatospora sp. MMS16-BH015]